MTRSLFIATLLLCTAMFTPAFAQQDLTASDTLEDPMTKDADHLAIGLGSFNIFDGDSATDIRAEYRPGTKLFWEIKPWAGVEATTDGTIWGGGGVLADFWPAPNIYLTPSVGAGLYSQGGSDTDLGSVIEFRTQIEGGYEFMNGHRLGVAFSHMSNAGIDDENPGAESLNLYYQIPIAKMF